MISRDVYSLPREMSIAIWQCLKNWKEDLLFFDRCEYVDDILGKVLLFLDVRGAIELRAARRREASATKHGQLAHQWSEAEPRRAVPKLPALASRGCAQRLFQKSAQQEASKKLNPRLLL